MKLHKLHSIDLAEKTARVLCTDDDGVDHNVEVPLPGPLAGFLEDAAVADFCRAAVVEKAVSESKASLDDSRRVLAGLDLHNGSRSGMEKAVAAEVKRHAALLLKVAPDELKKADKAVKAAAEALAADAKRKAADEG